MNAKRNLLDCQSPTELIAVLRAAAYKFRCDAADLQSSWQDPDAGRVWDLAAGRLETTADAIEKYWERL